MKYLEFDCGCKFPIINEQIKSDGFPSIRIDYENLNYKCSGTWELFAKGLTKGVFQLESNLGQSWAKKVSPVQILDLAALVSIMRPGSLKGMLDNKTVSQHYVDRKNGEEEYSVFHPLAESLLKDTYGLFIYQEQIINIANIFAGFSPTQADKLRKCVTKDTMFVSKSRGWITIKELLKEGYADDHFLVMDENGNQTWEQIDNIWSTGKHTVNNVETEFGYNVWATQYHQFLSDTGWKARRKLNTEDFIVSASSIEYDGKDDISEDLAVVIAGIITEGYFAEKTKNGNKTTSTFVAHEQDFMGIFKRSFLAVFGVEPKLYDNGRVVGITIEQRKYINKYLKYGLSDTKYIPSVMMRMTKNSMAAFLSFMLGAEGGVCGNGHFEYSSKSKKCVEQVKYLLLRYGIRSLINSCYNKKHNATYYKLHINDLIEQKKLISQLSFNWPNYKRVRFAEIISNKDSKNYSIDRVPTTITHKLFNQYPFLTSYEGGYLYSKHITRQRFNRLAYKSTDRQWSKFADGKHSYTQVVRTNKKKGDVETFDFSIKNKDRPFIIANGLVIHNSMGKKLPELMAKCRDDFMIGCNKVGIIDEQMANILFDIIEKSNRYSFNLSHSVSYSVTAYQCANIKHHFPHAFFVSCLSLSGQKLKPKEEIAELVREAKQFNIVVENPNISYKNENFIIDNGKIRYGLGSIKSVGVENVKGLISAIDAAEQKLGKNIKEFDWYETLLFVLSSCRKDVTLNLIHAGALSQYGMTRQAMLFEYNKFNLLNPPEVEWIQANATHSSLTSDIGEMLIGKKIGKPRREKIENILHSIRNPPTTLEDSIEVVASCEEDVLGISLSCSKLDAKNLGYITCTCSEFQSGEKTQKVIVAMEIGRITEWSPKDSDKKICFLTGYDKTGKIEVMVPSREYEKYSYLIFHKNTISIQGSINNKSSLTAKVVTQL